jgi:hypothetical protein
MTGDLVALPAPGRFDVLGGLGQGGRAPEITLANLAGEVMDMLSQPLLAHRECGGAIIGC